MPELSDEKTVHCARKEHTCSLCGWTIKPGDSYTQQALLVDGKFCIQKTCDSCYLTKILGFGPRM